MRPFKDKRKQAAYETARAMHDTLAVEKSGRGNAYRRGLQGQGWDKRWTSYPVWRAGYERRKEDLKKGTPT